MASSKVVTWSAAWRRMLPPLSPLLFLGGAGGRLLLLAFLFLFETGEVEVVEVGLDVVRVAVHVRQEELRYRRPARRQFLGQAEHQGGPVVVLLLEGVPPL